MKAMKIIWNFSQSTIAYYVWTSSMTTHTVEFDLRIIKKISISNRVAADHSSWDSLIFPWRWRKIISPGFSLTYGNTVHSFLNNEMAQVFEILPNGRQGSVYHALPIPWLLMTWRLRRQVINSHGNVLVIPEYSRFSTRSIKNIT